MNRYHAIILAALLSVAVSCTPEKKDAPKEKMINPNGESELAVLMRSMIDFSKTLRLQLINDSIPQNYPEAYQTIFTAKETEGMIENKLVFNGFANHFISTMDSIYDPGADHKKQFNTMISSCISCHNAYCQGPIPTIRKLYIPVQQ